MGAGTKFSRAFLLAALASAGVRAGAAETLLAGASQFLVVGFEGCHWCEVLKRETMKDPAVVAALGRYRVTVVDRDDDPAADERARALAGPRFSGYPLALVLSPAGGVLDAPAVFPAGKLADALDRAAAGRASAPAPPRPPGASRPDWLRLLDEEWDERVGGWAGDQKIVQPELALALLRARAGGPAARSVSVRRATDYLDRLRYAAVHDLVSGGFHRSSSFGSWDHPHFEKLTITQLQLAQAYVDAYLLTSREEFAAVARETLDFVLRELSASDGTLATGLSADSPGEGDYYLFRPEELADALGREGGRELRIYAALGPPLRERAGGLLSLRSGGPLPGPGLGALLRSLAAVREKRPRPLVDARAFAGVNGLGLAVFSRAAVIFDSPEYASASSRLRRSVARHARNGVLRHEWSGSSALAATEGDRAACIAGLLAAADADPSFKSRSRLRDDAWRLQRASLEFLKAAGLSDGMEFSLWPLAVANLRRFEHLRPAEAEELRGALDRVKRGLDAFPVYELKSRPGLALARAHLEAPAFSVELTARDEGELRRALRELAARTGPVSTINARLGARFEARICVGDLCLLPAASLTEMGVRLAAAD